jgi:hypothetical protein
VRNSESDLRNHTSTSKDHGGDEGRSGQSYGDRWFSESSKWESIALAVLRV